MTEKAIGFGFIPSEGTHHFLIDIPPKKNDFVMIYERFDNQEGQQDLSESIPKARISRHKWLLLADAFETEFTNRLKKKKHIKKPRFKNGHNQIELLLGKEILVLIWAVEDCDPSVIPKAIRNWLGLAPEERWWLYTMTNASTGNIDDKKGWRKALRYALTENPILETRQRSLIEPLMNRED